MRNIKLSVIVFGTFICFILSWCWKNWSSKNQTTIDMLWYSLAYDGNQLEKVNINNDDPEEILELYQEVWEDSEFRDSLLIAEKYSRWMWVFAFAQDNLQALKDQELKI